MAKVRIFCDFSEEKMGIFTSGIGNIATAYRDGMVLVVPSGSSLPPVCVRCGAPAPGKRLTKTFRWHSPGYSLLVFLGLVPYLIALIVRRKVRLDVPFCDEHLSRRARMNVTGAALLIGFIPVTLLLEALNFNKEMTLLIGATMLFAGVIVVAIMSSWFNPVYIDETCAKFKGPGEQFLSSLPIGPASGQQSLAS